MFENVWHYVKDGELPPLDTNVLVVHRWARTPEVGKRIKVFINSDNWVWAMCSDRFRYTSNDENVIAWIALPELPKSESKGLKVSDLKIGDVIKAKTNNIQYSITGIDYDGKSIFFAGGWVDECTITDWEIVK